MNIFKFILLFSLFYTAIRPEHNLTLQKDLVISDDQVTTANTSLQVLVDRTGRIFIANKSQNSIWLYTKEGTLKKRISREGRGPGEFIQLQDIFLGKHGELYGLDGSLAKIAKFSPPSYEHSGQIKIRPVAEQSARRIIVPNVNRYLVTFYPYVSLHHPHKGNNRLCWIDKEGAIKDTILTYPKDQSYVYIRGNQISTLEVPFGYKSILRLGPKENIYWARTDKNFIQVYNEYGTQINRIKVRYKSVNISANVLQRFKKFASTNKPGSQIFKKLLNANVIPSIMPVFDWFIVDNFNRTWVAVNIYDRENYSLRVYDERSNKMAEALLPKDIKLQVVRNGYAYGIKKNEDGIQSVIRFKINGL